MSDKDEVDEPIYSPQQFHDQFDKTIADLYVLWDRIGFDEDTKASRQAIFIEKLMEACQGMYEAEEELEENIKENIKLNRHDINHLCMDLDIKYDETYTKGKSILDESRMLSELKKYYLSIRRERLDKLKQLSFAEQELCSRLKLKETIIKSKVPKECELKELESRVSELKDLVVKRRQVLENYQTEAIRLNNELDSNSITDNFITLSINDISLSEESLRDAERLIARLQVKVNQIHETIRGLKFKISQLWSQLDICNEDLIQLVKSNEMSFGMSNSDILICLKNEHERCARIKMENMQKFITKIRKEISLYSEKMYFSDEEIQVFQSFLSQNDFTEELLITHEAKLEDLRFRFEENRDLYEGISKWLNLWDEFLGFEERTKDPNRFKTRGYNSLEEEKLRKQFNTQFPRLEDEIAQRVEQYEELNERKFTIFGAEWDEYIKRIKQSYNERKANEKREKQMVKDQVKYGEMKYGSKAALPLSRLHNGTTNSSHVNASIKRKNDCTGFTGHTPSILARSKMARTDDSRSTITRTPKAQVASRLVTKSKIIKRKSKTPNNLLKTRKLTCSKITPLVKPAAIVKVSSKAIAVTNDNDCTLTSTCSSSTTNHTTVSTNINGYPFRNVNTNELSYVQFSKELTGKRPFKFVGGDSGLGMSNASSHHSSAHGIQAIKEKEKLMSTLIKE